MDRDVYLTGHRVLSSLLAYSMWLESAAMKLSVRHPVRSTDGLHPVANVGAGRTRPLTTVDVYMSMSADHSGAG